jgi:small-conductance mechanosensitive channel/CRP-like cAMP-binding protein
VAHYPAHLAVGSALLIATLAIRLVAVNRLVRSKLALSALLFGAYLVVNVGLARLSVTPEEAARWGTIEQLVLALGLINLLVSVAVNPLRVDRVPERFPRIVQDAITVALFVVAATVLGDEKYLTTSAIGAVVVGFALQDTLGNAFAGLAIQVEKPFRVGHWIKVADHEGQVAEITWRATKLRTKLGNFVVLPNNKVSQEAIANYSEPVEETCLMIQIGASYDAPPNAVKAAILEAVARTPLALATPAPDVLIHDFGDSAVIYHVRFWIGSFGHDWEAGDQVRSAIYYGFRRHGIEIPYPIQVEISRDPQPASSDAQVRDRGEVLRSVGIFGPLTDEERAALAHGAERVYGAGEAIVRQGEPGTSMFVVRSGRARVAIEPGARQVAIIEPGGFFGEMSLLTGDPRTATVTAITDVVLLEITGESFRRVIEANPAVIERIGLAVVARRAELDAEREAAERAVTAVETPAGFLLRVRRFLGLGSVRGA